MKKPSKFRLVKGTPKKKDAFLDLNSGYRNADGSILAVGEEKIALTWGTSGKDVVFCLVSQDPAVRAAPKFFLRTDSVVTDLAFSEVDPELFATGQENGTTRLWRIPAGALAQDLVQPETELRGVHKKKVTSVAFSPVASGVIATGGGEFAAVWVDGEARFVLPHTGAAVFSVAWSPDGALLVTTTADKKTRVWDPRKSVDAPVLEYASCHDGVKAASALFVSKDNIVSAGFNKNRERQLQLWSVVENKQLAKTTLDSGTGVLSLLFDGGSGLVFVGGKSDASVRVFETGEERDALTAIDPCGDPALPLISLAILPKRQVNVNACEVVRLYGVTTATSVVPISFVAPRKVQKFDPELFPLAAAAGAAACSGPEWASGFSGPPKTLSLDPLIRAGLQVSTKAAREQKEAEEKGFRRWNESSAATAEVPETFVAHKIDVNAPEVKKYESVEYKQVQVVRSSSFRHVFGQPFVAKEQIAGLSPSRTAEGTLLAASSLFFAVPYDGPGGRLAVLPAAFAGRLPEGFAMVETGSTVADFCFASFHPSLLVTGQENGVLLWQLPESGLPLVKNGSNLRAETAKLVGHRRRVTSVVSNPAVEGVLASLSAPCGELKVWDLNSGLLARSMDGFDGVFGASWNYTGSLLACIGGKDGIRVVDPRAASVTSTFAGHDLAEKTSSVLWDKDKRIVSCGFGKGSQRQVRVYDVRKSEALTTFNLDISNGALTMHLDVDTGVLFLAGKGDGSVQLLELTPEESKCVHELTAWRTKDPQTAVCFLPKQTCDVAEVEIARMLKLHADRLEPVRFIVPRQRKEYFQDDLFGATRSVSESSVQAQAWLGGAEAQLKYDNLCPKGMIAVSVAPAVEKEKKPSSAYFLKKAEEHKSQVNDAEAIKDNLFKKVTSRFKEDENAAKKGPSDVAEEEWN